MRLGIAGVHYGHIPGMVSTARDAANAEIVGLVEADDALYDQFTRESPIPRFRTLEEMLAEAAPDIVLEGLGHHEKVPAIEACAAAGVHVFLDKPLCRTLEEWGRIRRAVEAGGIRLTMYYTSRSYPPFIALREAVLAGELGEIVSLISTHPHRLYGGAPDFYFDPQRYVGTFSDVACHGVDQVRWLTGAECVGVHAYGTRSEKHRPPRQLEMDHVQASYQLSSGAGAVITADWLTPEDSPSFGDTRFIIMGTRGSAHLRAYAADGLLVVADGKGAYEPDFSGKSHGNFVENMVSAFEKGEENFITTEDVLAVSKATIMAEESARRGGEFLKIE